MLSLCHSYEKGPRTGSNKKIVELFVRKQMPLKHVLKQLLRFLLQI